MDESARAITKGVVYNMVIGLKRLNPVVRLAGLLENQDGSVEMLLTDCVTYVPAWFDIGMQTSCDQTVATKDVNPAKSVHSLLAESGVFAFGRSRDDIQKRSKLVRRTTDNSVIRILSWMVVTINGTKNVVVNEFALV